MPVDPRYAVIEGLQNKRTIQNINFKQEALWNQT